MFIVTLWVLALLPAGNAAAGEPTDSLAAQVESKITLNYLCGPDSVVLTAVLSIRRGDFTLALMNAPVEFSAAGSHEPIALGKTATDQEGIARCSFPRAGLPPSADGMIAYTVHFNGNEKYPPAGASFAAKPATLRLTFDTGDSIRTLSVTAIQWNEKGEETAVAGETVLVYVPRLFSLLKVGEITLDENGNGTLEFPNGIVGDSLGSLKVVARIEEHDTFGFVQGSQVIGWGVPKHLYKAETPSRELWTPVAPLWMIITLIIMLAGVWAHYGYAVYELVMIRRLSKKKS